MATSGFPRHAMRTAVSDATPSKTEAETKTPEKGRGSSFSMVLFHFCLKVWWLRQGRRPRFNPSVRKIPLEKGMATHSSILTWRIPWMEEPGGLQFMGF